AFLQELAATLPTSGTGPRHLPEEFELAADTFHRFADDKIRPVAEHVHRTNADIPEEVISGLAEPGGFGMSVPEEYDGFAEGGKLEGRVIDTLGYRGMHSYEVSFSDWFVPAENLLGLDDGLGRGFYLQMVGFENGRLQTAARAVGLMQASFDTALAYSQERK